MSADNRDLKASFTSPKSPRMQPMTVVCRRRQTPWDLKPFFEQPTAETRKRSMTLSYRDLSSEMQTETGLFLARRLNKLFLSTQLPAKAELRSGHVYLTTTDFMACTRARLAMVQTLEDLRIERPACGSITLKHAGPRIPSLFHTSMTVNDFLQRRGFLSKLFELQLPTIERWLAHADLDTPALDICVDGYSFGDVDIKSQLSDYLTARETGTASETLIQDLAKAVAALETHTEHGKKARELQVVLMQESVRLKSQRALKEHKGFRKITTLLGQYHEKRKAGKLEEQLKALRTLRHTCHSWVVSDEAHCSPFLEQVRQLEAQATVRIDYLEKLIKALRDRNSLTDSGSQAISIKGEAVLEAIDPLNRPWGVRDNNWSKLFHKLKKPDCDASHPLKFFQCLETLDWTAEFPKDEILHANVQWVINLTETQRLDYRLRAVKGDDSVTRLFQGSDNKPYDTRGSWTASSGNNVAILVVKNHQIYTAPHELGKFHHSSFFGGHSVDAAGELAVENGVVKKLTLFSGHYRPPRESAKDLLDQLHSMGISLEGLPIKTVEEIKIPVEIDGHKTTVTKRVAVSYLADELRAELHDGEVAPRQAERGKVLPMLKLLRRKLRREDRSHSAKVLSLPQRIVFDARSGSWIGTGETIRYGAAEVRKADWSSVRVLPKLVQSSDDDALEGYI